MNLLYLFFRDEEGAAIAEYSMLLGLVMVAVVSMFTSFGTRISSAVSKASAKLIT